MIVLKMNSSIDNVQDFHLDLNEHWIFQKTNFTELFSVIQIQGHYVIVCVMWFCMHVETVEDLVNWLTQNILEWYSSKKKKS